jgi:hypothetical protein
MGQDRRVEAGRDLTEFSDASLSFAERPVEEFSRLLGRR